MPASFAGRLRDAPVVLLFLSPGFNQLDLKMARSRQGRSYYAKRRTGRQSLSADWSGHKWFKSRIKIFGLEFSQVRDKIAVLNIGAYHSRRFTDYPLLAALPSSRISLDWAQSFLFPKALKGKRVVVCLRAAHFWGLEAGKQHGRSLFAPHVTRGGHIRKKTGAEKRMRKAVIQAVRRAVLM
ncbi:MAG TPA: hypothetical protein VGF53_07155 [Pseudolabrys sp.]